MNRIKWIAACLACLFFLSAQAQTKVIAHRGYWKCDWSAQNSIASLMKAAEAGAYGAEFDVLMTRDREIVVNHDKSINGVVIPENDYSAIRSMRLSNGEIISTLDDYLNVGKQLPGLRLVLEIKPLSNSADEIIATDIIVSKVRDMKLEGRVDYISFSLNVCERLVAITPESEISYLKGDLTPAEVKSKGIDGIDYSYGTIQGHPEWIAQSKAEGLKVNIWTVNTTDRMNELVAKGVDYITTDHPVEALRVIGDYETFAGADWKVKQVADGITLKQFHFTGDEKLFDSHQYVSIIEIDKKLANGRFAFANDEGKITRTSKFAKDSAAVVACNGTFYNMSEPYNCVCYFKKNGEEAYKFTEKMLQRDNGAVLVSATGAISVVPADTVAPGNVLPQDWAAKFAEPSVMTSGPILMYKGKDARLDDVSFNTNRHPRTAIAMTDDKIYIVAVDGRSKESANGVSLWELRAILRYIGVDDALNLDGGGSTTLYVAGEPGNGIVNHPSDRDGERHIVNSILFIPLE